MIVQSGVVARREYSCSPTVVSPIGGFLHEFCQLASFTTNFANWRSWISEIIVYLAKFILRLRQSEFDCNLSIISNISVSHINLSRLYICVAKTNIDSGIIGVIAYLKTKQLLLRSAKYQLKSTMVMKLVMSN
jgi:hypothetical protein